MVTAYPMNTNQFCADWVCKQPINTRVLDYGCGEGQTVNMLRDRRIDAVGCDVFYSNSSITGVPIQMRPHIAEMQGDRIPFEDGAFDVVISDMVLEHVNKLDVSINEIARVLKPNGVSMHVFPDSGVWLEGHTNIPFLHWFGKDTLMRTYYAMAMSLLPGLGLPLRGETRRDRWVKKCIWLDDWTHYRSLRQIHECLGRQFEIEHIEDRWFDAKFGKYQVPRWLKRWIVRKFAGNAVVLRKRFP
jgi:SAM-dependent methyltransferase